MYFRNGMKIQQKTSRERHKSAPYLKLKNSKKTSKCQVFSSKVPEKPKSYPKIPNRFRAISDFNINSVAKYQKNERDLLKAKKSKKVAQCRKKLKARTLQSLLLSQMLEKVSGLSRDSNVNRLKSVLKSGTLRSAV